MGRKRKKKRVNYKFTENQLIKMSRTNNPRLRAFAIAQENVPIDVIRNLRYDKSIEVCCAIARCERSPKYILHWFANHKNPIVRIHAAKNPYLSYDDFIKLHKDKDDLVRLSLASNRALYLREELKDTVLRDLLEDEDELVRNAARKTMKTGLLPEHRRIYED